MGTTIRNNRLQNKIDSVLFKSALLAMLKKTDHIDGAPGSDVEASRTGFVRTLILRGGPQALVMIIILAIAFAAMSWLIDNKNEPAKHPSFKTVYTVDSVLAKKGTWQPQMVVYGEVLVSRSVDLRSLVAGEVVSINPALKVGGRLEKGASLIEIDRFTYEGELSEAKANREETQARIAEYKARISMEVSQIKSLHDQLEIAQSDYKRIAALRENGTATAKQVEDRALIVSQRSQALEQSEINLIAEEARLDQQNAILGRLNWKVKQAERYLKDTVLVAPFSGIISENQAEVGRMVGVNDLVVSMYDGDQLDVRFTLTDQRFGRIQSDREGIIGRKVEVIWSVGGEEFRYPAVIERIGAQITSNRGGVEVYATIGETLTGSPLRPGAFVEVIVPDKSFEAHYKVPETAIYSDDTVYVIKDGELIRRDIQIAARDGDTVIIAGDLNEGEEILATRISEISEGLKVRTEADSGESG